MQPPSSLLRCGESLPNPVFTNDNIYAFEPELARLYPDSRLRSIELELRRAKTGTSNRKSVSRFLVAKTTADRSRFAGTQSRATVRPSADFDAYHLSRELHHLPGWEFGHLCFDLGNAHARKVLPSPVKIKSPAPGARRLVL